MVKLSDITSLKASNVTYNDQTVEQSLGSITYTLTTVSGGCYPPKVVKVNPEAAVEETGKLYKTWAAADSYIAIQSPSATNRFVILMDGVNTEAITVRPYVTIRGTSNSTILQGPLRSSVSYSYGMDTTQARVDGCIISNVALQDPMEFIQFRNCDLAGGTPSSGFLQLFDGYVTGGDYSNMTVFQLFSSMVVGGILHREVTCINSELYNNYTIQGGDFTCCLLANQGNITVSPQAHFKFDRCTIEYGINIESYYLTMTSCTFKGSPQFEVYEGGMITTRNCAPNFSVEGVLDNWENVGAYYDNRKTYINANTMQDAIDKLGNTKEYVDVINSSGGTLRLDMNIPNHRITLTEDITTIQFDNVDGDISSTTLYITQGASQNYTIDFSGIYFSGGVAPDLSQGSQSRYVITFVCDGGPGGGNYGFLSGSNMTTVQVVQ